MSLINAILSYTTLIGILILSHKIDSIVIPECRNFTYTPETTLGRIEKQREDVLEYNKYKSFYDRMEKGE